MPDDGGIADTELPASLPLLHPCADGLGDVRRRRRGLRDGERPAIGDDGFEADGLARALGQPIGEGLGETSADTPLQPLPREWPRCAPPHKPAGRQARLSPRNYGWRSSGGRYRPRRQSSPAACISRWLTSAAPSASRALDIGLARGMRLEIEKRRTEGANGEAKRFLKFIGSGRRRAIALREQGLELFPVEIGRRHAMAMMIDQRQSEMPSQ